MTDYKVRLDIFEGPMDLLLHLIKEQELNVYDIPIARITKQYFQYLDLMKDLNLEVAGEFLVMASTLTYIKSRMLLPSETGGEDDEEGEDPREELVRKLIEYKKFKEASQNLREREQENKDRFAREFVSEWDDDDPYYLKEVSVFQLLGAFHKMLEKTDPDKLYEVRLEEISVTEKMTHVLEMLEDKPRLKFEDCFQQATSRMELIGTLLALLELMKQQMIRVFQEKLFGPIWVQAVEEASAELRDGELEPVNVVIDELDTSPPVGEGERS